MPCTTLSVLPPSVARKEDPRFSEVSCTNFQKRTHSSTHPLLPFLTCLVTTSWNTLWQTRLILRHVALHFPSRWSQTLSSRRAGLPAGYNSVVSKLRLFCGTVCVLSAADCSYECDVLWYCTFVALKHQASVSNSVSVLPRKLPLSPHLQTSALYPSHRIISSQIHFP